MSNGEDVVQWFSKEKFLDPPSMAIRFQYISSLDEQVFRF